MDHIMDLNLGGKTEVANITVMCSSCNAAFTKLGQDLLPTRTRINGNGSIGGKKIKGDSNWKLTFWMGIWYKPNVCF